MRRRPADELAPQARALMDTVGRHARGAPSSGAQRAALHRVSRRGGNSGRRCWHGVPRQPGERGARNGTAAHALDYDDMCFVCWRIQARRFVAAARRGGNEQCVRPPPCSTPYVVGFERLEGRIGRAMNQRHVSVAGHCTSDASETIGAAAAESRFSRWTRPGRPRAGDSPRLKASGAQDKIRDGWESRSHAGLAAGARPFCGAAGAGRNDGPAPRAIDVPQGFRGEWQRGSRRSTASRPIIGIPGEIVDPRHTVKLYPSAPARTRRWTRCRCATPRTVSRADVDEIDIGVDRSSRRSDSRPAVRSGLEGKVQQPFLRRGGGGRRTRRPRGRSMRRGSARPRSSGCSHASRSRRFSQARSVGAAADAGECDVRLAGRPRRTDSGQRRPPDTTMFDRPATRNGGQFISCATGRSEPQDRGRAGDCAAQSRPLRTSGTDGLCGYLGRHIGGPSRSG